MLKPSNKFLCEQAAKWELADIRTKYSSAYTLHADIWTACELGFITRNDAETMDSELIEFCVQFNSKSGLTKAMRQRIRAEQKIQENTIALTHALETRQRLVQEEINRKYSDPVREGKKKAYKEKQLWKAYAHEHKSAIVPESRNQVANPVGYYAKGCRADEERRYVTDTTHPAYKPYQTTCKSFERNDKFVRKELAGTVNNGRIIKDDGTIYESPSYIENKRKQAEALAQMKAEIKAERTKVYIVSVTGYEKTSYVFTDIGEIAELRHNICEYNRRHKENGHATIVSIKEC